MDLIDFFWNASQQDAIAELRSNLRNAGTRGAKSFERQSELISLMQQENDEMRIRLGVLIRLLIQQGAITAGKFSAAVNEAKASIALAQTQALRQRATRRLPKPPKLKKKTPGGLSG